MLVVSYLRSGPADALSNGGGLTYGTLGAPPGTVVDFPVTVENQGSAPVTLLGASLIPVPGSPTPRLIHLGVLAEHVNLLSSGRGWPVWKGSSAAAGHWLVRPLRGYLVLPWSERQRRHLGPLPDMIEYGVAGTRLGADYWAAGLAVTYRAGGHTYTQKLYAGGGDCVERAQEFSRHCAAADARANRALEKLAER